jgi:hypothetical protein
MVLVLDSGILSILGRVPGSLKTRERFDSSDMDSIAIESRRAENGSSARE